MLESWNVPPLIYVILLGIVTFSRFLSFANAKEPMLVIPSEITIFLISSAREYHGEVIFLLWINCLMKKVVFGMHRKQ